MYYRGKQRKWHNLTTVAERTNIPRSSFCAMPEKHAKQYPARFECMVIPNSANCLRWIWLKGIIVNISKAPFAANGNFFTSSF